VDPLFAFILLDGDYAIIGGCHGFGKKQIKSAPWRFFHYPAGILAWLLFWRAFH